MHRARAGDIEFALIRFTVRSVLLIGSVPDNNGIELQPCAQTERDNKSASEYLSLIFADDLRSRFTSRE